MNVFGAIWVFVLLNSFIIFLWNYLTQAVSPIKTNGKKPHPTKLEKKLSSDLHVDIIFNLIVMCLVGL